MNSRVQLLKLVPIRILSIVVPVNYSSLFAVSNINLQLKSIGYFSPVLTSFQHSVVAVLLDHESSALDLESADKSTPLHLASEAGHASTVAELLKRGAARLKRTTSGKSAVHLAAGGGHTE